MANISLRYYLISRYVAILIVLVLFFALSVIYLQLHDMDDTSEYYMQYEAEMLSSHYQTDDRIKEFDLGFKEYYWAVDKLPERYQELITDDPIEFNQLNWYQSEHHDIYIYPYRVNDTEIIVVHLFSFGDYGDNFTFSSQYLTLTSLLLLLITVIAIAWVSRKAVSEISHFQHWLKRLDITHSENEQIPETLSFTELQRAADTLISSRKSEFALQQQQTQRVAREKAFLSTLSHELRTPIAIISAAISLLEKRGTLLDKDEKIVAKLSKANGNMKKLTNTLLQLWRKQQSNLAKQNVNLQAVLSSVIESYQQNSATEISFITQSNQTQTTIETYSELVDITLQNILRNACQYSADNKVFVTLDDRQLTVKNTIEQHKTTSEHPILEHNDTYSDYGFGLGLYLVENICEQQHWQLLINKTESEYSVLIIF
ncbi:MAG: HAMP domain-containing histidine kinase [Psychromonas sp.]|nr:HAMP domain-containing histidine kinase [Psychromonas sp.]